MKHIAMVVSVVAAIMSNGVIARAGESTQPVVISLADYAVTATPTGNVRQSFVFELASKTADASYTFEIAQDLGARNLFQIIADRTDLGSDTKLETAHLKHVELSLKAIRPRPIPARISKQSQSGKMITHELVSIKWSAPNSTMCPAPEPETLQDPRLKRLYADLRLLLRRHYPDASSHLLKNKISFEFNTRNFIIHIPLKTGEWQDPREERGPKKGGILGTIELREGKYLGAAMVPQSFDRRYYTSILMAPYSEKRDCHLYVHLYVPKLDSNPEFIKEFRELVNEFADKLDTPASR
ncbi:MAG: hypothetical protein KDA54_21945 [Phycisphaerales bacterium]|nr:hypothetical protein [Phycisphaerales bacterium]